MKKVMIGVAFAMVFSVACVPSPDKLCESGINLTCDKVHECTDDATKADPTFQAIYGADPAACKTALITAADCANVADKDDLCPAGETYTPVKAKKCKSATESQDCADFLAGTEADAACSEVCAAG